MNITPHVAQNDTNRRSAVDQRTTRHAGYEVSERKRKRVEQSFGWMKMVGMLKKVKLRGIDKVGWLFTFTGAAYNLCRLSSEVLAGTYLATGDTLGEAFYSCDADGLFTGCGSEPKCRAPLRGAVRMSPRDTGQIL